MNQDEIKELSDQQAKGYDSQWSKTSPIQNCLHLLLQSMFAGLPVDARILCVGVGTGVELTGLAEKHPQWQFTLVEPSGAMLDVCRERVTKEGFRDRCHFHEGFLESLPTLEPHDAATCFLVSQFILEPAARSTFFREIADRLKSGALLASSDLSSDIESSEYAILLPAWMNMISAVDITPENLERVRHAYANDVAVLAAEKVEQIIKSGGFESPVQFFQAGLIRAWLSKRI
ncbi:class I SAM-dependent methyltransferase [Gynuella sunshinyii]|uniref:Methylase involved in ubiquinone/menaquinone biosynthesis n=1 Tax=Gynuella sunshinyii YC6258 TaxID=1445510 RepID=A0A0C5VBC3_9GAMM|nr:class I SAM-dependent methyltransferase [Gynuella sunshinyii]AJQ96650.1 methylase involved in ubiquinone/menaquinone biosynthesis [Gynuella sunshinyii YC6258]